MRNKIQQNAIEIWPYIFIIIIKENGIKLPHYKKNIRSHFYKTKVTHFKLMKSKFNQYSTFDIAKVKVEVSKMLSLKTWENKL